MKLDLNQLRDILIAVSNELVPDEYGFVPPISPKKLVKSSLSQYPENETLYWIRKLMDEQILIKGKKYVDEGIPQIKDISMSGYRFIDSFKEPSLWEKVKPKLSEMTFSSLSSIITAALSSAAHL